MEVAEVLFALLLSFTFFYLTGVSFVFLGLSSIKAAGAKKQLLYAGAYIWFAFGLCASLVGSIAMVDYLKVNVPVYLSALPFFAGLGCFYYKYRDEIGRIRQG